MVRRIIWGWLIAPAAIMVLGWSALQLPPASGLDQSWNASLQMAIHNGVSFGDHVIFTYGPLGFLAALQLWHLHLTQLALVYTIAIRFAVAAAVFACARRNFGSVGGFVVAVVVVSVGTGMAQMGELVVFLALAVAVAQRPLGERVGLAVAGLSGAYAGFELLVKLSIGVSLALMTAILIARLGRRWWLLVVAALAGFAGSLVVFWILAGQPIGSLGDYLVNGAAVTAGYTDAMSLDTPGFGWEYTAALLGLGLGLWAAYQPSTAVRQDRRWVVPALWLVFWFTTFKEGFVRHDQYHGLYFFVALLAGFTVFQWSSRTRPVALVGLGALVALTLAAQSVSLTADLHLVGSVSAFSNDVSDLVSSSREVAIESAGRAQIQAHEPLDRATLALLQGRTVAIYPLEQTVAWAYNLKWDPIPVIQSYSAYTSSLDRFDADFLRSTSAPQLILFQNTPGIDRRVEAFDESETLRTMLCRYVPLHRSGAWALLSRVPYRCSAPQLLGSVRTGWGTTVNVPPPPTARSLVFVRISGTAPAGLERLVSFFFKPQLRFVTLNGGLPQRFVTGTAGDGLPLRAAQGIDYPRPFNVAAQATTLAVSKDGESQPEPGPVTFTFYAETVG